MKLSESLHDVMTEFFCRQDQAEGGALHIEVEDPWTFSILCDLPQFPRLCIRSVNSGDVPALHELGVRLGPVSKDFFGPYPWEDPAALPQALQTAVEHAVERIDASYLIEGVGDEVIGYFFLWKAGGNPHSQRYQVQIPELGVAIADEFQGKGLGSLSVRILNAVGRDLCADAIELTTALNNEAGWNTYRSCGYQYTGIINNPLGVDVTAAFAGEVQAASYQPERQMVYVLNEKKRHDVMDYLAMKREAAADMFG
ncbi:MAG: GNAT family N-acetyltransferase [Chloroflexi bacterium]|nr:GNAT family N-acetyltransferase [Chloroflexota bacterium]